MPKFEEFWHFYDKFTAEAQRAQSFLLRNFLCALRVSAVS
jgi:hypothetical protein